MPHHIIHKQTVTLHASDSKGSNLLQERVSRLFKDELAEAMEAVFDRLTGGGEVLRIERLELNLGTIAQGNFDHEFKTRLIDELAKAVPKVKSDSAAGGKVSVLSYSESLQASLQYFLVEGMLPWYAGTKKMDEWEQEVMEKFAVREWRELFTWLQKEHIANESVTDRLILQFSDVFILALLSGAGVSSITGDTPNSLYKDLRFFIDTLCARDQNFIHVLSSRASGLIQASSAQFPNMMRYAAWSIYLSLIFSGTVHTERINDWVRAVMRDAGLSADADFPAPAGWQEEFKSAAFREVMHRIVVERAALRKQRQKANSRETDTVATSKPDSVQISDEAPAEDNEKSPDVDVRARRGSDRETPRASESAHDTTPESDAEFGDSEVSEERKPGVPVDGNSELAPGKEAQGSHADIEGAPAPAKSTSRTAQGGDAASGETSLSGGKKSAAPTDGNSEPSLGKDEHGRREYDEEMPSDARATPGADHPFGAERGDASSGIELPPGKSGEPNAERNGKQFVTGATAGYGQAAKTSRMPAKSSRAANGEFIFVQNCGIVLLQPFLAQYFGGLGLLDKRHFADAAAQKRGVLLLHYLATGAGMAAEYDLSLQKILCGMAISEPMPNEAEFTEEEKTESENLLKAVTSHWKPLNNTSVEGLRTTFLQREGKMKQMDTGWKLEIPAKTVDVLIGKLPWGYSTIRLPWMESVLHVEWY